MLRGAIEIMRSAVAGIFLFGAATIDRRMPAHRGAHPAKFDLIATFGYQDRQFIPNYNFPEGTSDKDNELVVYADVVARFAKPSSDSCGRSRLMKLLS